MTADGPTTDLVATDLPAAAGRSSDNSVTEAVLTEVPQCNLEPCATTDNDTDAYQRTTINHPAAFTFPCLSPDGSVEDLCTSPTRRHRATPPAALSSLAAKLEMADSMSDSTASLADSTYDMVDDASEVSTDDHDTASLLSTERNASDEGQITPDDIGSIVDVEELRDEGYTVTGTDVELPHSAEQEDVYDSLLSDDLETPRASTITGTLRIPQPSGQGPAYHDSAASAGADTYSKPLRVLFISDRSVSLSDKLDICRKVTTSLAGSSAASVCDLASLPATPSGLMPSSGLAFRNGNVVLLVQHCINAIAYDHASETCQFNLYLLDADQEHSSVYIVGRDTKPDFGKPDLALLYLGHVGPQSAWLSMADAAMRCLGVPVLQFCEQLLDMTDVRQFVGEAYYKKVMKDKDFQSSTLLKMDDQKLRSTVDGLLGRKQTTNTFKKSEPVSVATHVEEARPFKHTSWSSSRIISAVPAIVVALMLWLFMSVPASPVAETALRREAFSAAFGKVMNTTDISKIVNLDHLLPQPSPTSTGIFGQTLYSTQAIVASDFALPNHVLFSLPKKEGSVLFPSVHQWNVRKGDFHAGGNLTRLIEGVYDVTVDPAEAFGWVTVDILTKNPVMNTSAHYYLGHKMLQRKTYEHAGTELSKSVNKELTVLTKAARSFGGVLGLELTAGAAATKNVTAQIAKHVARDLKAFANTASSIVDKVGQECNQTVATIRKDLMTVQKDLVKFTKQTVRTPLKSSMDSARGFRDKVYGRGKAANSTSSTGKELSTYFHDMIYKPFKAGKKPIKLRDVARCVTAKSYKACRKAQNDKASDNKSLSTFQWPKALSTVPGQKVKSQPHVVLPPSSKSISARSELKRALAEAHQECQDGHKVEKPKNKRAAKKEAEVSAAKQKAVTDRLQEMVGHFRQAV